MSDGKACVLVYITEQQAKGQFVQMARRLIETGILKPSALDLAKRYDSMAPRSAKPYRWGMPFMTDMNSTPLESINVGYKNRAYLAV
jgi:hypothetical protein